MPVRASRQPAWIVVDKPPRERPRACAASLLAIAGRIACTDARRCEAFSGSWSPSPAGDTEPDMERHTFMLPSPTPHDPSAPASHPLHTCFAETPATRRLAPLPAGHPHTTRCVVTARDS